MTQADRGEGRLLQVSGVERCTESFGEPDDPSILLVSGGAASMDWWPATLLALEGVGHQMPPRETWDLVVPAILEHTSLSA